MERLAIIVDGYPGNNGELSASGCSALVHHDFRRPWPMSVHFTLIAPHPNSVVAHWRVCSSADCLCPNHSVPLPIPGDFIATGSPTYLDTNDWPSSGEEVSLRAALSASEASLARIEVIAADLEGMRGFLQTRIAAWRHHRDEVQAARARYRQGLHPISRLPSEILASIFAEACVNDCYMPTSSSRAFWGRENTVRESVWSISWTSRRWREVAHGCPRLWSTIRISVDDQWETERKLALYGTHRLNHFLRLSATAALGIAVGSCAEEYSANGYWRSDATVPPQCSYYGHAHSVSPSHQAFICLPTSRGNA